jgi:hypothetical protein
MATIQISDQTFEVRPRTLAVERALGEAQERLVDIAKRRSVALVESFQAQAALDELASSDEFKTEDAERVAEQSAVLARTLNAIAIEQQQVLVESVGALIDPTPEPDFLSNHLPIATAIEMLGGSSDGPPTLPGD